MKLLITSDIHYKDKKLIELKNKHPEFLVHLDAGDSQLSNEILDKHNVLSVCGNTDYMNDLPVERILTIDNIKILVTHGHLLGVKSNYSEIIAKAENLKVDICIFGHTHQPLISINNEILYLNPGSLGYNNTYIIYKNKKARIHNLYE